VACSARTEQRVLCLGVGCWRWCATAGAELLKDLASNQILRARVRAAASGSAAATCSASSLPIQASRPRGGCSRRPDALW
jgi:hypothetical protein